MNNTSSNSQKNSIQSFIDKLINPPALHNPLRRPNSQKNTSETNISTRTTELQTNNLNKIMIPTPIKKRSRSEDKSSELFSSTKNYVEPQEGQSSAMVSKISEISENPFLSNTKKQVKFRESMIQKNSHNKRQNLSRSRTPSILKKSQLLRESMQQSIQTFNTSAERQGSLAMISGQDRQSRAAKTNEIVKKRFFTILQRFQAKLALKIKKGIKIRNEQKYKDELFPPITSSVFRGATRVQQNRLQDVKWVRLPDLFKNRKITVLPTSRSKIQIYCNKWRSCNNFIGDAFTSIKDCKELLQKMFEITKQCEFGIYLVKIFQENVWKYVIIDDYIPVYIDQDGNCIPIYLNICEVHGKMEEPIQIWPFLLEKAYANYYSNYQSLHYGNALDFLQEITGTACQTFLYTNKSNIMSKNLQRLQSYLQRQNTISLGYIQQQQLFIPLYRNQRNSLVAKRSFEGAAQEVEITMHNIFEYFDKIYIILPTKWSYSAVSTVGINVKRGSQELPRFDISLRILKVTEASQVSISIRQKQKRFYQNSSLNYNYIWNRIIILQKQFQADYRWHSARYSSAKTVNFTDFFQAGQYFIVLIPEWKCSHCYELSVIVQATQPISITRKEYNDKDRLLQKGCADLAQRFGKLEQINLYACSYCIVEDEIGFIIENINNQRFNGDIRINRSINGIKSSVDLIPFNIEFYQQRQTKMPFRTHINVYIQADKSYTVILMTRGGVDLSLLKRFDFAK